MSIKCAICGKHTSRMQKHLKECHSSEFGGLTLDEQKHLYYFKYYKPSEDPHCPYCGKSRKCSRFTRALDTCASSECKAKFSSLGAKNQIKQEGGVDAWQSKRVKARSDFGAGLRKVNKNQNEYLLSTGFRDRHEKKLAERLDEEGISYSYQDRRFFTSHSHSLSDTEYINFIPDFIINNLVIEIDGWSHRNKQDKDLKQDNFCLSKGYKVLRVSAELVDFNIDFVVQVIKEMLSSTTIKKKVIS